MVLIFEFVNEVLIVQPFMTNESLWSVCSNLVRAVISFDVVGYTRKTGGHKLKMASHEYCPLDPFKLQVALLTIQLPAITNWLPATNEIPVSAVGFSIFFKIKFDCTYIFFGFDLCPYTFST